MKTSAAVLLTLVFASVIALGTLSPPGDGDPLPIGDKPLHMIAFAVLVLPLGWVRPRWFIPLGLVALAYGGLIEVLQPYVGRYGEWPDLLADGVGVVLGLIPGQLRRRRG